MLRVTDARCNVRAALVGLERPWLRDAIAGLVTGLFSIPAGMAYASIGGFNPVAGLYSGMVSTVVSAISSIGGDPRFRAVSGAWRSA